MRQNTEKTKKICQVKTQKTSKNTEKTKKIHQVKTQKKRRNKKIDMHHINCYNNHKTETKFEINEDSILFFIHIQCHSAGKSNKIEDLHEAV